MDNCAVSRSCPRTWLLPSACVVTSSKLTRKRFLISQTRGFLAPQTQTRPCQVILQHRMYCTLLSSLNLSSFSTRHSGQHCIPYQFDVPTSEAPEVARGLEGVDMGSANHVWRSTFSESRRCTAKGPKRDLQRLHLQGVEAGRARLWRLEAGNGLVVHERACM